MRKAYEVWIDDEEECVTMAELESIPHALGAICPARSRACPNCGLVS
jgi:hypothetical protein